MAFEALFSPGRIGQLHLKNRIVMSPMVTYLAEGGLVGCETAEFMADRAQYVAIVELREDLAADSIDHIRRPLLRQLRGGGLRHKGGT